MNRSPHFAWFGILIIIGGCDPTLPLNATSPGIVPIGVQTALASPELEGQAFRNLLQFEQHLDSVFVQANGLETTESGLRAHSGKASLRMRGGSGTLHVKLASLLGGDSFPGSWTLIGGYFYCESTAQITVVLTRDGKTLSTHSAALRPGQWGAAMTDLGPLIAAGGAIPELTFKIEATAPVWVDDVLLVNNKQDLVGDSAASAGWSVRRDGFVYNCRTVEKFSVQFATADATADGWTIAECNEKRIRLTSSGKNKRVTIYADGRSYWDGAFKALASDLRDPLFAQQQQSPALIQIAPTQGRLDRRTDGDVNNDGYNECRGAYELVAITPRLEFVMQPQSSSVFRPVIEIAKLPAGKPVVTVEGQVIESVVRLSGGTLLIDIPARFERPTTVTVHVLEP